ncbi:MAG TPA: biotin/lipoyl-binding protein, partial [Rhizobiaceae bacterium]|nr:biotin/lipoyl-binding protein [Rhizobiaceae bacterium]
TDTSDAWRLASRRKRLMIDGAGIMTELMLAVIATWLWVLLPDGLGRSIAFSVATVGWVASLGVNLSPFMRFDGYYLFSDAIGVQNLQQRAFALGRWRLREWLFGLGDPVPEVFARPRRRLLVAYAYATWIYRFFLFLGIALLVYHFFIKVVAIILFAIEIVWFIARPIASEIGAWWSMREKIVRCGRAFVSAGVAVALVAACFVPWSTPVRAPAVLAAKRQAQVFTPWPGMLQSLDVARGDVVRAGDVLFRLSSEELQHELKKAEAQVALAELRIARIAADAQDRALLIVLNRELESAREHVAGVVRQIDDLTIRAPIDGRIAETDPDLRIGMAIGPTQQMALVVGDAEAGLELRGYVDEAHVARLSAGTSLRFVPDNPLLPVVHGTVREIAETGSDAITIEALSSVHGGPIRSDKGHDGRIEPRSGQYAMLGDLDNAGMADRSGKLERGMALVEGEPESLASWMMKRVAAVAVRESGF